MDSIVIGAGVMGLLTARELAQAGMRVCVLDKSAVGQESSWAGGGILSPLYPWRYAEPVQKLAKWSQLVYPDLIASLRDSSGVDPERLQSGLLFLDSEEKQAASRWAEAYQTTLHLLDKQQIAELSPNLGLLPEQGLWFPDLAQVRNPRLMKSLKLDCLKRGVDIRENLEVESLLIRNNCIRGVQTSGEKLESDNIIVCGGAWTANLLQDTDFTVEIQPVKGQMLLYKAQPEVLSQIVLNKDRYLIPRKDGRILVGSTLEYTGFDKSTSQVAQQNLQSVASHIVPALARYPVEKHWAGLRPGTTDGIPYIYADSKIDGLYVNSGHFRNGVVLGPASARLTADLVLGRQPIIDPALFKR